MIKIKFLKIKIKKISLMIKIKLVKAKIKKIKILIKLIVKNYIKIEIILSKLNFNLILNFLKLKLYIYIIKCAYNLLFI